MNIVFLDIDGVLNSSNTKERCLGFLGVDKALAKKLRDWELTRDVAFVLSSTWRLHPPMHQSIRDEGVDWIDVTPSLPHPNAIRGDEIQLWLDKHVDPVSGRNEVDKYAILDDNDWFYDYQSKFFVQTENGLEDKHLNMLDEIFGFENEKA